MRWMSAMVNPLRRELIWKIGLREMFRYVSMDISFSFGDDQVRFCFVSDDFCDPFAAR